MELQDFLRHFNTVQICSLSPEVLGPSPAGGGWHTHIFQGRWVRGFNSGGSQPAAETFWTNPQFRLTLLEPDEEDDEDEDGPWGGWGAAGARGPARGGRVPKCTVLLSLIQRNRRCLRAQGLTYLTVGFHVFQAPSIPLDLGLKLLFQELAGEHGRRLALHHFQQLWGHLREWQAIFDKFDQDASGTMNSHELRLALNAAGFHLNNQLTQALTSRYRDSRLRVDLERFVSCVAQLTCIFCHCSQHLDGGEGVICLTRQQWMEMANFS
ncbi:Calpain-12 [Myotis brandtii]|uniref:Calpain-12 n=1 Tax=Myotis brandtii TaxID=109478 RepID=S7MKX9_MYOBR|nr:Calpain-12 [Myotis brandtii]